MSNIPTAHNACSDANEIAKTVLMPGDPLRAKFIADNFLENVKMFTSVRNVYGYTGEYKGRRISVMASGMGMPSIGIYAYELYNFYNVEEIIRIGSAGAYSPDLKLFDVVLADSAYSDSNFAYIFDGTKDKIIEPDIELNRRILASASALGKPIITGRIYSSDVFYNQIPDFMDEVKRTNCVAVEMESFALFAIAKRLNKKAACLLTISNTFTDNLETTAEEREKSFTNMMEIALGL